MGTHSAICILKGRKKLDIICIERTMDGYNLVGYGRWLIKQLASKRISSGDIYAHVAFEGLTGTGSYEVETCGGDTQEVRCQDGREHEQEYFMAIHVGRRIIWADGYTMALILLKEAVKLARKGWRFLLADDLEDVLLTLAPKARLKVES